MFIHKLCVTFSLLISQEQDKLTTSSILVDCSFINCSFSCYNFSSRHWKECCVVLMARPFCPVISVQNRQTCDFPYQQEFYQIILILAYSSKRVPAMASASILLFLVLVIGLATTLPSPSSLSLAHRSPDEFARLHRPLLRFDGSAETYCYPDMVSDIPREE